MRLIEIRKQVLPRSKFLVTETYSNGETKQYKEKITGLYDWLNTSPRAIAALDRSLARVERRISAGC